VFVPVRNRVQRFVDRRFFRKKYDYPQALKGLSRAASEAVDSPVLLNTVAELVQQVSQNRAVVIFTRAPRDRTFLAAAKVGAPDEIIGRLKFGPDSRLLTMMDSVFEPGRQELPEEERQALRKAGSALIVPVKLKDELVGFISLGRKQSDGEY